MMSMSDGTSGTTAHARLPASDGISRRIARLQHEDAESRAAATMLRSVVEISGHGARYTFFISKMIWGVSLFMECGDWNENWKTYPRVSRAAGIIRTRARGNGWKHAEVIAANGMPSLDPDAKPRAWDHDLTFDHARTISDCYRMMVERRAGLTFQEAAFIIAEYPPVIITTAENASMTKRGFKNTGEPERRYDGILLEGFTLRA
jgi:hypothetical protein